MGKSEVSMTIIMAVLLRTSIKDNILAGVNTMVLDVVVDGVAVRIKFEKYSCIVMNVPPEYDTAGEGEVEFLIKYDGEGVICTNAGDTESYTPSAVTLATMSDIVGIDCDYAINSDDMRIDIASMKIVSVAVVEDDVEYNVSDTVISAMKNFV